MCVCVCVCVCMCNTLLCSVCDLSYIHTVHITNTIECFPSPSPSPSPCRIALQQFRHEISFMSMDSASCVLAGYMHVYSKSSSWSEVFLVLTLDELILFESHEQVFHIDDVGSLGWRWRWRLVMVMVMVMVVLVAIIPKGLDDNNYSGSNMVLVSVKPSYL